MTDLFELHIDAIKAAHPRIDMQKGKYLTKWQYKIHFRGDVPRTAIKRFASEICADTAWTSDGYPTVYFNNLLLHKMARSVAEGVELREAMTVNEALKIDASWEERGQYRVLFEAGKRPDPCELAMKIEDDEAEVVSRCFGFTMKPDGSMREKREVVAVVTNREDTMALLRLGYPGTVVENRQNTSA